MIRTLADFPEIATPLLVHPQKGFGRTAMVHCPCCNRVRAADTIVDVRAIPGTEIRGGNRGPAKDHDWLCDGGLHLVYHHQPHGWTQSKLYRALGAPAAVVRHHRAREIANAAAEADWKAGHAHDPLVAFDAALASLPQNTTVLPGTEAPNVPAGAA